MTGLESLGEMRRRKEWRSKIGLINMTITIHYLNGNDTSCQNHYLQKEYRDDIIAEIDGLFYDVYFFTIDSLKYEMRRDGFCSFPGMIILDEINNNLILNSINTLADIGYFDELAGRKEMFCEKRYQEKWYVQIGPDFKRENAITYG